MGNILNVDYILTLKKNESGTLYVEEVEIPLPKDILQKLSDLGYCSQYGILDVIRYVDRCVAPFVMKVRHFGMSLYTKKCKYCWPYEYNGSFTEIQEPLFYCVDKSIVCGMDRNTEIKQKEVYVDAVIRYMFAMCYAKILPSVRTTSLMYSNDITGFHKSEYFIADNVSIQLHTNFGYGRSSYFHVNLKYKGINILPYTDIVRYYWSNMMDNMRYTADFVLCRESWKHALSFVEKVSNLIVTDNEKFEKEWIIEKVEGMMEGLKTINDNVKKYYEALYKAKVDDERHNVQRVIEYRCIDSSIVQHYKIYPQETLLTIQVDKLSAALALLDDLKTVQCIYASVQNHIDTIIQYNEKILPTIALCRTDLQSKLKILKDQLQVLQERKENVQNGMKEIEIDVNQRLEETNVDYQQLAAQDRSKQNMLEQECKKDEKYKNLLSALKDLNCDINKMQTEIRDRASFDSHLAERNEYIEKTLKDIR